MSFRSGCLKPALFGCLGLTLLVLVIVGVAAIMAVNGVKQEQVADTEVTSTPPASLNPEAMRAIARRPGRVELDLSQGEFNVVPGEPGTGVRVKARFDQTSYELVDSLEVLPDSTWVYRVEYRRTIGGLQALMRGLFGGSQDSRVEVQLPPDVLIDLVARMHQGGGSVELGGLWIGEAELEYHQGGFELDVSEPLREPMERLVVHGSMGGVEARRLGNASPRLLVLDANMGGGDIDLRGRWLNDARVDVKVRMGGMALSVPAELAVTGAPVTGGAEPLSAPEAEVSTPTLDIHIDQSMGEVEIIRR